MRVICVHSRLVTRQSQYICCSSVSMKLIPVECLTEVLMELGEESVSRAVHNRLQYSDQICKLNEGISY
jgi:hypothetical protein